LADGRFVSPSDGIVKRKKALRAALLHEGPKSFLKEISL